ncbi:KxYKxGKxW signal peptide domain-containing protein [Lactobacillus sp. AN1001]
MQKSELKKRYKMYKSGKNWIVAPIVFLGLALGLSANIDQVSADVDVQASSVSQTAEVRVESETSKQEAQSGTTSAEETTVRPTEATLNEVTSSEATQKSEAISSDLKENSTVTKEASETDQVSKVEENTSKPSDATSEARQNVVDDTNKEAQTKQETEASKNIFSEPTNYVEKKQDGSWYLYDTKTNTPYTGFQKLKDERIVYYNNNGQMQHGWQWIDNATRYFDTFNGNMAIGQQKINDHWYLFNEKGEMQRGFQNIPKQNKTVYYNKDGWMLYGWQWVDNATRYFDKFDGKMTVGQKNINGHWYLFNEKGAMQRGFQYLPKQDKTVYYNKDGWMLYGWQWVDNATHYFDTFDGKMAVGQKNINGHWYLFNEKGAMQRGFQYLPEQNKTVYYNQDGWMLHGQQRINGYWYNFDTFNGAMKTGFVKIPEQNKTVYYNSKGQMQYGWQWVDNATRYFDTFDGKMAVGQKNINGHWYLFNEKGAMQRGFQYIPAQNKTVYYNQDGWMLYGVQQIDQNKYYFDLTTGAMKVDSAAYDKAAGKLNYYGKDGKQVTNVVVVDGKEYNFANGALTVNGQQLITLKGNTYLLDGSRVLTGQQKLNDRWYYFDENTAIMIRGFKYIADQNKTVYYGDNGQMVYGWKDLNGRRYFFDRVTGAQASSEILWIDGNAYAFDSQGGARNLNELAQLVNQLGSNIAVAIQSQKSGQIYAHNNSGNMRYRTASTIKVAVLAELLHNTGGNLTAYQRSLAENMIRNSDNDATTNLINNHLHEASSPVNRLYRDLGMNETTPGVGWGSTLTTPTDQLKLLYQIYMTDNSSYLNRQSQDYIKYLMHTINVNQRWGISAGSSDYYLKNGWVTYTGPWYVNSIGFIPNSGHGYTIAIYSYNNPLSTGINKIEQVARKASQMLK